MTRSRQRGSESSPRYRYALCAVAILLAVASISTLSVAAAHGPLRVDLHPVRHNVSPGETLQVGVVVSNTGDAASPAPVFAIDSLPPGWSVSSWSGTDAAYRNSTREWLWTKIPAGATKKFVVTLSVPKNATGRTAVAASVSDGNGTSAVTNATVTVRAASTTQQSATQSTRSEAQNAKKRIETAVNSPGFGVGAMAFALATLALRARRAK